MISVALRSEILCDLSSRPKLMMVRVITPQSLSMLVLVLMQYIPYAAMLVLLIPH